MTGCPFSEILYFACLMRKHALWRCGFKTRDYVKRVKIGMNFNSIVTNRQQIIPSTGCALIFSVFKLADAKVPAEEAELRDFGAKYSGQKKSILCLLGYRVTST